MNAVIGLKNKVSDLVDDTISYITVVVEQISEKFCVITVGVILSR